MKTPHKDELDPLLNKAKELNLNNFSCSKCNKTCKLSEKTDRIYEVATKLDPKFLASLSLQLCKCLDSGSSILVQFNPLALILEKHVKSGSRKFTIYVKIENDLVLTNIKSNNKTIFSSDSIIFHNLYDFNKTKQDLETILMLL